MKPMRFLRPLAVLLFLVAVRVPAQTPTPAAETPLWMRYPAISPDGKTVVFAFRGHLFTVRPRAARRCR